MQRGSTSIRALLGLAATLLLTVTMTGTATAQGADTEKELEKYREMINDPMANPGYLSVDRGEDLWKLARGKKNVSLETCDLGEGPGKLEGAYARLPRYFKDTDAVMDLEQRLLWCMKSIQELDVADVVARKFSGPGKTSDMEDLVAYIGNKSNGMKIEAQVNHPKEKEALALGERIFYTRASVLDFSCATCHLDSGRRIRLQPLPQLSKPGRDARDVAALDLAHHELGAAHGDAVAHHDPAVEGLGQVLGEGLVFHARGHAEAVDRCELAGDGVAVEDEVADSRSGSRAGRRCRPASSM